MTSEETRTKVCTSLSVNLSPRTYDISVIKKSAYRFLDRAIVEIVPADDNIECILRFRTPEPPESAKRIADDFIAEVLDQDLRRIVAAETEPARNAILAYAFSRTGLQDDE